MIDIRNYTYKIVTNMEIWSYAVKKQIVQFWPLVTQITVVPKLFNRIYLIDNKVQGKYFRGYTISNCFWTIVIVIPLTGKDRLIQY